MTNLIPGDIAHRLRWALAALLLAAMTSACMTPYQPRGVTGGYTDQKVNGTTYRVSFFGNGNTPKDRVFRFWLYRCADLTAQNGFDYFTILGKDDEARLEGDREAVSAKGGGDGFPLDDIVPARGSSAPSYVYIPGGGGTITTWSASGYIVMRKGAPDPDDIRSFSAKKVLADIGAEVRDANTAPVKTATYDLDKVLDGAPRPPRAVGKNGIGVEMSDLKDLLPANAQ
jgi:hypothetical protein